MLLDDLDRVRQIVAALRIAQRADPVQRGHQRLVDALALDQRLAPGPPVEPRQELEDARRGPDRVERRVAGEQDGAVRRPDMLADDTGGGATLRVDVDERTLGAAATAVAAVVNSQSAVTALSK